MKSRGRTASRLSKSGKTRPRSTPTIKPPPHGNFAKSSSPSRMRPSTNVSTIRSTWRRQKLRRSPPQFMSSTHVDVIPPGKDDCMAALKAMSVDTAKDPGNIGYQVLVAGRPEQSFHRARSLEQQNGADAHAMASAHAQFSREALAACRRALRRALLQGARLSVSIISAAGRLGRCRAAPSGARSR